MRQNIIIFSSANRWRGLPAAHPSGHCQDPVNQVRTRPEDLQLHPHAEERGRRVRPSSINTHLQTFDKISSSVKLCDSAATREKQVEAIIFKNVHLPPPPPSSLHDGQY